MWKTPNQEIRVRIIQLFLAGNDVNYVCCLLNYEYSTDVINATIRELLRAHIDDFSPYSQPIKPSDLVGYESRNITGQEQQDLLTRVVTIDARSVAASTLPQTLLFCNEDGFEKEKA